ncbi:hypothetical protein L1987_77424 [Smallanthus sonchifolius]|uniref:Uncharacterized protein n=1 Tax=Smallanthus sonchifolius TaxID=185202 RepID=A0ACB8Z9Y1_9ASTR|nr:hypothetical protein L1987_77424 [Smallanthus sonchifolius]
MNRREVAWVVGNRISWLRFSHVLHIALLRPPTPSTPTNPRQQILFVYHSLVYPISSSSTILILLHLIATVDSFICRHFDDSCLFNILYTHIPVAMDFLEAMEIQVGLAVAVLAVVATATYFYSLKKTKVGSIDPENFKEFKLVKRTQLSHNVARFRFALPTPTSVLGLPIGQHISCRGKDSQGEEVIKPYTPTTLDIDVGYFELVIKMYPQGRMSHHFRETREGDYLPVRGPKGRFRYQPGQVRAFGMLAGGSGITPMFQVARAILENPKDTTQVHLIYANVTYDDILLKEEIDGLATNYPDSFHVYYVLNQPPEEWTGGVGYVSKEMIQTHCPAPASDIKILRCGPPPMNKAMAGHLDAVGYSSEMQFQF